MAIVNESKPTGTVGNTKLNVGSGFNLLIGSGYDLLIGAATALGQITNTNKVSVGETWATITTTWTTETRTWLAVSQLIGNTSKPSTSVTNVAKP